MNKSRTDAFIAAGDMSGLAAFIQDQQFEGSITTIHPSHALTQALAGTTEALRSRITTTVF